MKQTIGLLLIIILPLLSIAQKKITISGSVKDIKTGEVLIGGTVYITNEKRGTTTNSYGFYSITTKEADSLGLIISYQGYQPKILTISGKISQSFDYNLEEKSTSLKEVIVSIDKNNNNVSKARMSVINIPMKQIKTLPAIAGERDILKVVQLLPGVQSGQEGTTGFYVRGGNTDQNLILLDEGTVYNPSHLFGLFSTFNTNAINSVTLIKGGYPAQFGGRLSSILDITMKEGNKKKFSGEGGIGLISSNLTLEGPIKKNKSSFIISARRTFADLIVKAVTPKNKNSTNYTFYDVNAKANFEVSKKDKLYFSFFKGLDNAKYVGLSSLQYGINFGNATGTVRWNHLFNNKLFSNTSFIYNDYHLSLTTRQDQYYAQLYTGIKDVNFKTDFSYFPSSSHSIKAGFNYSYSTLFPSTNSAKIPKNGNINKPNLDSIQRTYSSLIAFYINDDITISEKVSTSVGLRVPVFIKSDVQYLRYEPRATIKYQFNDATSMKAAYTMMNQFQHLVPNSTASLPTDIWISSSKIVKPQNSQQVDVGLFKNFKDNTFEASIEVYYKTMNNQVLFKEGAQSLPGNDIDTKLTFGKGNSYGTELFIKKNVGRFTGWLSYTLSWTNQTFDSLNYGKQFPFTYDKRHSLSIVGTYELNKHWTFSGALVLSSGGAFTLPTGRATVYGDGSLYDGTYYDYAARNNYRYRTYHRLDLSAIYHRPAKIFGKKYESELAISVYNIYNRHNPYFIYLNKDAITKQISAREVSLLPIIPAISYNFKF
ncbi:MAG: TonB-dependent receptor [Bacteroidota bacterium]|nr:TonB-dependent receptor [Bacteroidota bacterium]